MRRQRCRQNIKAKEKFILTASTVNYEANDIGISRTL